MTQLTPEQIKAMETDIELLSKLIENNAAADLTMLAGKYLEYRDILSTISAECKKQEVNFKLQANEKRDEADRWKRKADTMLEYHRLAKKASTDINQSKQ